MMDLIDNLKQNRNYHENYVPVNTKKQTARVNIRDILYIETELRTVNICTGSRTYRFYGKLDDVIKYLNGNFHRCHKSCIINFEKILRMEDGIFYFTNGATLRIGQNNYRLARNKYIKYLEQNAFKFNQNAGAQNAGAGVNSYSTGE